MKALATFTLSAIDTMLAAGAAAQTTTDEARASAARDTAEQQREASARPPVAEPMAAGDYRAQAHERARVLQWRADQQALRSYAAIVRLQPLAVNSEDSARSEAHRLHGEQALAQRAAELRTAAAAQ